MNTQIAQAKEFRNLHNVISCQRRREAILIKEIAQLRDERAVQQERHADDLALLKAEIRMLKANLAIVEESRRQLHGMLDDARQTSIPIPTGPTCKRGGCNNPIEYKGTGRIPEYCSNKCRLKAWRETK